MGKATMSRIILWTLYLSLAMLPFSAAAAVSVKGDLDDNNRITLQDAVMAVRIASGLDAGAPVHSSAEVSGDQRIGIAEGIYVFQCLSGIRASCTSTARLALDGEGTVLSSVKVADPEGSHLILYAGTRIVLRGENGATGIPTSENAVFLSLEGGPAAPPSLPAGVNALGGLRIVLTVDGVEHDAWFIPAPGDGTGEQGLKLTMVVDNPEVTSGTFGLLFDVSSGSAIRAGSSSLVAGGDSGGGGGGGGGGGSGTSQMQFSPGQTGSYNAGGVPPGTGPAPTGAFWSKFNVPDPGCINLGGGVNVCGEKRVESVEITELSTADILADCFFGTGNSGASGVIPPGYQFWCTQTPGGGGSIDITISSMQANLPIIRAKIVRAEDNLPMFWTYHQAVDGLHGPDGVYSDPYQKKEFEFAGYKRLIYTTKEDEDYSFFIEHAVQPLREAGYTANSKFMATSPGFIGEVAVHDTLDGRVKIEDDVIKKEEKKWKVVAGEETQGNKGKYEYIGRKYRGTAKATLRWPGTSSKVWEIIADVTFEKDKKKSTKEIEDYAASGSITATVYTAPQCDHMPSVCWGEPASFENTYPIGKGDGDLWIKAGSDPVEYLAAATIQSSTTSLPTNPYKLCYRFGDQIECTDETMEPGEQEHMWLMTALGGAFKTGDADGRIKGTFQHITSYGSNAGDYEWDLAPVENNP